MGDTRKTIVLFLFAFSVMAFITGIVYFAIQIKNNRGKSINQKLYTPTFSTFVSIFLIRYAIAFYDAIAISENAENISLSWIEGLLNSLVHALQTFSLDASYTETITMGKALFANEFGSPLLSGVYGFFVAFQNICAPIMGGTLLLGILVSAFPRLNLWLKPFRCKYVFSELNDKALCFAEDIIKEAKKEQKSVFLKLPLIIFTDAYTQDDSEADSELHQSAKELGAICIKDDILRIRFSQTKELYYMLLDEDDMDNIHTLTALITEHPKRWNIAFNTYIYVFSQNSEVGSIIRNIYEKEESELTNVIVKIVQEHTSIAYNLYNDVPLYYPLITKYPCDFTGKKELSLTIVGEGNIAIETFLAAYWCGQMLDCILKITLINNDVESFKIKINNINPEILQTSIVNGKSNQNLLRVFPHKEIYATPYAEVDFLEINCLSGELLSILKNKSETYESIIASDYFVIALDSDEINMILAAEISRLIKKNYLGSTFDRKPIIAYSIYNSATKEVLNTLGSQTADTYLHAFAAHKDIYSCKNIFMKHINDSAFSFNAVHSKTDMKAFLKDEYNWWSSIARVLHRKYKMFSVGLLRNNDLCSITENEYRRYLDIVNGKERIHKELYRKLTWLEHRRWNAFLRTKGFIAPSITQWEQYAYSVEGITHKHIDLKLHPCIVECSESIQITDNDWDDPLFNNNMRLDYLDIVSIMVYQKQNALYTEGKFQNELDRNMRDYKIWDEPIYDEDLRNESGELGEYLDKG